jgi:hypothetical protein
VAVGARRSAWATAAATIAAAAIGVAASGPTPAAARGARAQAPVADPPMATSAVRPPTPPWILGNTAPDPPVVRWSGPPLIVADSPEVVTPALLAAAKGGVGAAHLLYADRSPRLASPLWVFAYVRNALPRGTLTVWLQTHPLASVAAYVRYGLASAAVHSPDALVAGVRAAATVLAPGDATWGPAQRVPAGGSAIALWRLPPGQVLCLWWRLTVTSLAGRPLPLAVSLWLGPGPRAPVGGVLPPGPTGVVRTTLAHVDASVTLTAPVAGAWAYDFDNDAPTPGGGAGGVFCPPSVCLNGEVTTYGGAPFPHGADPLPGELQGGVDAVDAPGHAPAVAVADGADFLRTGNYGDYGAVLTIRLAAPPGRVLYAAAVPGYDRSAPWVGTVAAAGHLSVWRLGPSPPPYGLAWPIVGGVRAATLTTTVTAGAYAPLRIVLWSGPAPASATDTPTSGANRVPKALRAPARPRTGRSPEKRSPPATAR